jgi:hypothetical protein
MEATVTKITEARVEAYRQQTEAKNAASEAQRFLEMQKLKDYHQGGLSAGCIAPMG